MIIDLLHDKQQYVEAIIFSGKLTYKETNISSFPSHFRTNKWLIVYKEKLGTVQNPLLLMESHFMFLNELQYLQWRPISIKIMSTR